MSHTTSESSSVSRFDFNSIFNSALDDYQNRTRQDLTSHPLLTALQDCNSPDAVLAVLREQIPLFGRPQNVDDRLTRWLVPTVNVLCGFSATVGEGVSLVLSPTKVVFAAVGALLLAAKDVRAHQDMLIDLFSRIEYFFKRLEAYTGVPATDTMRGIIVDIIVQVIYFLSIATKEIKRGGTKKYFKELMGNTEIKDALQNLDRLTQEEARIANAELLNIVNGVHCKVVRVNESIQDISGDLQGIVQGVNDTIQSVRDKVEGVHGTFQRVDDGVHEIHDTVRNVGSGIQDVHDLVQAVGGGVQDIRSTVQDLDNRADRVDRKQLRERLQTWLSATDPSINHNILCDSLLKGTAQWFIRGTVFNQWKATGSFLWVHGKQGSGKSILCSAIIQDVMNLRNSRNASVAYFYFDSRDSNKQGRRYMLHSLLIQLSVRSDTCCDILSRLYSAHDNGVQKPSDRAMTDCLKEMLTLPSRGPTYIILDALDECPNTSGIPSPREGVLELVNELVDLRLPTLHICVTSRPEIDIQSALQPLIPRIVSLHEESGQQQDITAYINHIVHSDKWIRRWRKEDKDLVIKILSDKADGMFRWVFCQLEVLRQSLPSSVRHILEELPESLDETYERILKGIRKPSRKHAYRLMQCLVVAVRPLRVEELAEVLAVDFDTRETPILNLGWRWSDHQEAVLSACSSLVTIVKDGDSQIVQFSHCSVKEFLMSDRLAESSRHVSRYHIQLEPAHTILAQVCLGVLLRLDDGIDRSDIESFPLARYAAEYWVKHAQFGKVSSQIEEGMDCLFDVDKPHFSTWLWIYNEDRPYESLSSMRPSQADAAPLYHAVRRGFRDLAKRLLDKHPEHVIAKDVFNASPLHASVSGGHIDVFSLLIEYFPNVDVRDTFGQTPLHLAAWRGHVGIGKQLLSRGADVNGRTADDRTPLYVAAVWGQVNFARLLLGRGATVHIPDRDGRTPLHAAVSEGEVDAVRLLMEHGADPNARDRLERTPFTIASSREEQEIVQLLSKYGAKCTEESCHFLTS